MKFKTLLIGLALLGSFVSGAADRIIYEANFNEAKNEGWIASKNGKWEKATVEKISDSSQDNSIYVEGKVRQLFLIRPSLNIDASVPVEELFIKFRVFIESVTPVEYLSFSIRCGDAVFIKNFTHLKANQWLDFKFSASDLKNKDFKKIDPASKITRLQLFTIKNKAAPDSETVKFLMDSIEISSGLKKKASVKEDIAKLISDWKEYQEIVQNSDFSFPLVDLDGKADSFILTGKSFIHASPKNISSAKLLGDELKKIFGGNLKLVKGIESDRFSVFISNNAKEEIPVYDLTGIDDEGFLIESSVNGILIAAKNPKSLSYGLYSFLEGIGYRWFMPGSIGECLPEKKKSFVIKAVSRKENPFFEMRFIWYSWGWLKEYVYPEDKKRFAEWLLRNKVKNKTVYYAYHTFFRIFPKEKYFEKHPEYYALINGKRNPDEERSQICYSNGDVPGIVAEYIKGVFKKNGATKGASMTPNDHPSSCRCEKCSKFYAPGRNVETRTYAYGYPEGADLHINFMNAVRKQISKDYPEKYLCSIVNYGNIVRTPVNVKPDKNLVFGFTTMPCCKLHSIDDLSCPVNVQMLKTLEAWAAYSNPMYLRDYDPIVYWKGLPAYTPRMVAKNIKLLARKSKMPLGVNTESHKAWASNIPDFYIRAKLEWNPEMDIDKLLDDFYSKFFGSAALDMKNYFEFYQYMLKNSPFHPVARQLDCMIVNLFPIAARDKMEGYLKRANEKCPEGSIYKKRIEMIEMEFEYFSLFLDMLNEMNAAQPDKAYEIIGRIDSLVDRILKTNRDYIVEKYVLGEMGKYRKRFEDKVKFRKDKKVIPSPNRWSFKLDNKNDGLQKSWQNSGEADGWDIIYSGNTWENQGYDYDGVAWYKAKVFIPDELKGKKIMLFVGALDESGVFYINGKKAYVREFVKSTDWRTPFEFDATEFIDYGKENDVTIRVLDKAGAGGIWKDIFFYWK